MEVFQKSLQQFSILFPVLINTPFANKYISIIVANNAGKLRLRARESRSYKYDWEIIRNLEKYVFGGLKIV